MADHSAGYGRRWKRWLAIYVVAGAIAYALVYFLFFARLVRVGPRVALGLAMVVGRRGVLAFVRETFRVDPGDARWLCDGPWAP